VILDVRAVNSGKQVGKQKLCEKQIGRILLGQQTDCFCLIGKNSMHFLFLIMPLHSVQIELDSRITFGSWRFFISCFAACPEQVGGRSFFGNTNKLDCPIMNGSALSHRP
jgi:hypothetical protein